MTAPMKVLVVDDSAVTRETLAELLGSEAGMSVVTAADPIIAMRKIRQSKPDVIVLDLEMPRMSGLDFLALLMRESPLPVVICSTFSGGDAAALTALERGAVELIAKPKIGVRRFLEESKVLIVDAVRAAGEARLRAPSTGRRPRARAAPPRTSALPPRASRPPLRTSRPPPKKDRSVIVMGASTGGTEAIATIVAALPASLPGMVIVEHMPAGFTYAFAQRLDEYYSGSVREACDGDAICAGLILVAPGDRHVRIVSARGGLSVIVEDGPLVSRHRPSIDVLFSSAATAVGRRAIGVLLTGMGEDGARGLGEMRARGAHTIAQDESTSVVFGMPKKAIERGAAEQVLPLGRIASAIDELAESLTT
jgi:two-component system chemotaxis response regulator CheB